MASKQTGPAARRLLAPLLLLLAALIPGSFSFLLPSRAVRRVVLGY